MLPWFHAGVSVCLPIGRPTGYYLCPPMLPSLEGALFLGTWGAAFPGLLLVVRRQDRLGRESLLCQLDKPLVDAIIEYAYPTREEGREEGASANQSCPNADSAHVSLGRRHCVRWRRRRRWRSVCR